MKSQQNNDFKISPRYIFLLMTIAVGILILWPGLNFQDLLSTGDHGRDLEASQEVLRGKIVYQDYWWVYGPLMPYYYAVFYKLFGASIHSILIGKFFIKLAAGIFCFLAVASLYSPLTAMMTALWFWTFDQDFFFTYSHIGGILMVTAVVWCLLRYVHKQNRSTLWQALAFCLVLALIKVNFGLSSLAVVVASIFYVDRVNRVAFDAQKKLFYFCALFLFPIAVFLIYYQFLKPLPMYEIRQCLPYSNADQPYNTTPWGAMMGFVQILWSEAKRSSVLLIFYVLSLLCFIQTIILWVTNTLTAKQKTTLKVVAIVLGMYTLANFHEFLKSGVWYRWFWAQPPLIVLSFILFETVGTHLHKIIRTLLWSVIGLMIGIMTIQFWQTAIRNQTASQFIEGNHGKVYVGNQPQWVATVNETTKYLNTILKPEETFFALPYDILYYYLTDRPSPSRQTIFFEHINIPPQQEVKIIKEIEDKKINTIVLSNRYMSPEQGLGVLGTTYCPVIGNYINDNFAPVARFGDWKHMPGWGWSHGTMILKRKSSL
ncbi:MAG: hypothetical protein JNN05_03060 [Candidatus Omnitrophica bacterium]|nr:hypothetical protein [Candidatus Omnitrophota bacterium]